MKTFADPVSGSPVVAEVDILEGLRALGVEHGATVLVHCALSQFGLVAGGEQAVLQALRHAVGVLGTVVMPSQSWHLCDPDFLDDPSQDLATRRAMRDALPAFDPALTPTRTMGRVAELFRTLPGSHRSPHPHRSFAAAGLAAETIVRTHDHDDPFGETSPLARLYDERATILLLGVGYESCTALHLAEARAGGPRASVRNGAPLLVDGIRCWVAWEEPVVDDELFPQIGAAFEETGAVTRVRIGAAECRSIPLADLIDFAAPHLKRRER
jgi:aminoglycoside 3-N-acetyltransferase